MFTQSDVAIRWLVGPIALGAIVIARCPHEPMLFLTASYRQRLSTGGAIRTRGPDILIDACNRLTGAGQLN
jgi:hypothetical protein